MGSLNKKIDNKSNQEDDFLQKLKNFISPSLFKSNKQQNNENSSNNNN